MGAANVLHFSVVIAVHQAFYLDVHIAPLDRVLWRPVWRLRVKWLVANQAPAAAVGFSALATAFGGVRHLLLFGGDSVVLQLWSAQLSRLCSYSIPVHKHRGQASPASYHLGLLSGALFIAELSSTPLVVYSVCHHRPAL